jgi:hypothetical protein
VEAYAKNAKDHYFRFTVSGDIEDIKFDAWDQQSAIPTRIAKYLRVLKEEGTLKLCVNALKPKAEWITSNSGQSVAVKT